VTAAVDFMSSAVYLDASNKVDEGVATKSGSLGVRTTAAPILFHNEGVQRALRGQKQTSLSASSEAANSPSSEVAEVQPRGRAPELVMAGLLVAAGVSYMARRRRGARVVSRAKLVRLATEESVGVSTLQKVSAWTSPGGSLTMTPVSSLGDLQEIVTPQGDLQEAESPSCDDSVSSRLGYSMEVVTPQGDLQEAESPFCDDSVSSKLGYSIGYVRQLAHEINNRSPRRIEKSVAEINMKSPRRIAASANVATLLSPRQIEFHRIMTEGSNSSMDDFENDEMPEEMPAFPEPQFYRIGTDLSWQSPCTDRDFTRIQTETSLPIQRSESFTDLARMSTEPSLRAFEDQY